MKLFSNHLDCKAKLTNGLNNNHSDKDNDNDGF